jgi:hypothetical protein
MPPHQKQPQQLAWSYASSTGWYQPGNPYHTLTMLWGCADSRRCCCCWRVCADVALQVDFDIATWDFLLHEEDPTSSEGPVSSAAPLYYELCLYIFMFTLQDVPHRTVYEGHGWGRG